MRPHSPAVDRWFRKRRKLDSSLQDWAWPSKRLRSIAAKASPGGIDNKIVRLLHKLSIYRPDRPGHPKQQIAVKFEADI